MRGVLEVDSISKCEVGVNISIPMQRLCHNHHSLVNLREREKKRKNSSSTKGRYPFVSRYGEQALRARAVVEWIGAVEDATRPQDVMTPALFKRETTLAFEVLDSKIAKGLK